MPVKRLASAAMASPDDGLLIGEAVMDVPEPLSCVVLRLMHLTGELLHLFPQKERLFRQDQKAGRDPGSGQPAACWGS